MIVQALITLFVADSGIEALVADRVYPRQLPDAPTFPAIVITKVYGRGEQDLAGGNPLEEARVQIDCYSDSGYAESVAVAKAVRDYLHGFSGPALSTCGIQRAACINSMDFAEPLAERAGPRLRRRMLEFTIWNTET